MSKTSIISVRVLAIAMCIFGLTLSRYSYMVMSVPNLFMIAAVTVLAVFGTYSVQNSFDDVIVMFALGTLMYVGRKFGFSPAPVVLGIILGPIAEDNFLHRHPRAQKVEHEERQEQQQDPPPGSALFLRGLPIGSAGPGLAANGGATGIGE